MTLQSPPPFRSLSAEWLDARAEHLLDETRVRQRVVRPRGRLLLAAAILVSAVAAGPALAFSTTVREFVGLQNASSPFLVATVTSVVVHRQQPVPMVTVTFTVGEHGKAPGTGVPLGSYFELFVYGKRPTLDSGTLRYVNTTGSGGRYSGTTLLPPGGVGSIQIGGWLGLPTSDNAADGEFWLPVDAFPPPASK